MAQSAMRPLTPEEAQRILEQFTGTFAWRNKALLTLGICTGFRISELLALLVDDVWYFGEIKDTLRLPRRLMKGNQPRHPKKIYPEAKLYLSRWIDQMKEDYNITRRSYLWAGRKSQCIRKESTYKIIRTAAERAGIQPDGIGNHSMRKTFANAVYDYWDAQQRAGRRIEPMRMVQLELGHASIDDTYRYMAFKMETKPDGVFADYGLLGDSTLSESDEDLETPTDIPDFSADFDDDKESLPEDEITEKPLETHLYTPAQ